MEPNSTNNLFGDFKVRGGHNFIDLSEKRFGNLVVLHREPEKRNRDIVYRCQCDCGNMATVFGVALRRENGTRSCGCLKRRPSKKWTGFGEISGTYWWHIKRRAELKKREFSLSIEEAWKLFLDQERKCALTGVNLEFVRQYAHKLDKLSQTASLDRLDRNKGYSLGNVQWLHKDVNKLKNVFSDEDLIRLACLACGETLDIDEAISQRSRINEPNWTGYKEISGTYWSSLKHGAKRRNMVFDITIEAIWELYIKQEMRCAISGIPLIFARNYAREARLQTASLDRRDNTLGYVAGNLQWIYKSLNRLKWSFDQHEFLRWCRLISEHYLERKNGTEFH